MDEAAERESEQPELRDELILASCARLASNFANSSKRRNAQFGLQASNGRHREVAASRELPFVRMCESARRPPVRVSRTFERSRAESFPGGD